MEAPQAFLLSPLLIPSETSSESGPGFIKSGFGLLRRCSLAIRLSAHQASFAEMGGIRWFRWARRQERVPLWQTPFNTRSGHFVRFEHAMLEQHTRRTAAGTPQSFLTRAAHFPSHLLLCSHHCITWPWPSTKGGTNFTRADTYKCCSAWVLWCPWGPLQLCCLCISPWGMVGQGMRSFRSLWAS